MLKIHRVIPFKTLSGFSSSVYIN